MFSVLLVDDEELVRVSIRYSISCVLSNVKVVGEAANGEEGIAFVRDQHPDIVITDIRMPRMDGLQMIGAIREESPDTPIIVLSGYADFEYARQAMKFGITDYLLKPVEEQSLKETLEKCIGRIVQQRDLIQEEKASKKVIAYINAHYQEDLFLG